jgi:hypothetical protein
VCLILLVYYVIKFGGVVTGRGSSIIHLVNKYNNEQDTGGYLPYRIIESEINIQ